MNVILLNNNDNDKPPLSFFCIDSSFYELSGAGVIKLGCSFSAEPEPQLLLLIVDLHIHEKKRVQEEAATQKEATDRNRLLGTISKVAQTRTKKGRGEDDAFAKWTTKECSTYLQYKKRPDDA